MKGDEVNLINQIAMIELYRNLIYQTKKQQRQF